MLYFFAAAAAAAAQQSAQEWRVFHDRMRSPKLKYYQGYADNQHKYRFDPDSNFLHTGTRLS